MEIPQSLFSFIHTYHVATPTILSACSTPRFPPAEVCFSVSSTRIVWPHPQSYLHAARLSSRMLKYRFSVSFTRIVWPHPQSYLHAARLSSRMLKYRISKDVSHRDLHRGFLFSAPPPPPSPPVEFPRF